MVPVTNIIPKIFQEDELVNYLQTPRLENISQGFCRPFVLHVVRKVYERCGNRVGNVYEMSILYFDHCH